MIWLILNDLDYVKAAKEIILKRSPHLDVPILFELKRFNELNKGILCEDHLEYIVQLPSPRCIKTHLHWSLLPEQIKNGTKQPKIIIVLRNPEDVCVSFYHHSQMMEGYKGTFEDYCELFLAGRVSFGPFWKLVLSYWAQRHRSNVLLIKFKDMKENIQEVIRNVAEFLNKSLTKDQVENLAEHLSFESMKENPSVNREGMYKLLNKTNFPVVKNRFMRSGKVGGFKAKMSPEMIERFAAWTKENLAGTGLSLE